LSHSQAPTSWRNTTQTEPWGSSFSSLESVQPYACNSMAPSRRNAASELIVKGTNQRQTLTRIKDTMENYTRLMAVAVYCQYSPPLNHLPSRQSFHIRRWLFSMHNAFRAPIFLGQMRACPANIGLISIMSTSNSFSVRFPRASTNDVSSRIGLKAFTFTDAFPGHTLFFTSLIFSRAALSVQLDHINHFPTL
jgi:hypothetical protein